MEMFEAAGLRVAVHEVGQGPPVILCHSFPLDSSLFAQQVALLSPDRRVLAFDFPGFGASPPPTEAVSFHRYAQALIDVLRQKRITQVDAVGMSMGSYALLELSRLKPQLLGRLVLGAANAGPPSAAAQAERELIARRAETEGVAWLSESWGPKLLRPGAGLSSLRTVESIILRASPQGVAAAARALAARGDQTEAARGTSTPTLVIHGAEDAITPVLAAEALARTLPKAQFRLIPGAGHLANIDEPDHFNRALVSFLES